MTRLSLATTAAILAFGAGVALAPVLAQDKAEPKSGSDKSELYQQLNLFGDVLERVRRDYVEPVDEKTLMENAIQGMLASLKVGTTPDPMASSGAPLPANAPVGLYMAMKQKYMANLLGSVGYGHYVTALHYYVFSPNGSVYCCYDFPPGGEGADWRRFDFAKALREDPVNTGRFAVQGDRITIQTGGQSPETTTGTILPDGHVQINTVVYERQK